MASPNAQVTYQQAMATLTEMFGGFDRSVIHMVLNERGGHMESTIEELMRMQSESVEAMASAEARSGGSGLASPSEPGAGAQLPRDFLDLGDEKSPEQRQIEADEMFARALQDQLFLQHLQNNERFTRALADDQLKPRPGPKKYVERAPREGFLGEASTNFSHQLSNMGEATKHMFLELRSHFLASQPNRYS